MSSVTSEPLETTSPAEKAAAKRRRAAMQRVRDARDRLTSSTGRRPAFDYELLRLFAQNRHSGSFVILLLVGSIGFLSSLWTGAVSAVIWTTAILAIHAATIWSCRRFLQEPQGNVDISRWRLRFTLLDLFFGLAWMFQLIQPVGVQESSGTFNLFVMLLVVAVASMLASSLPAAVVAASGPVAIAVALNYMMMGTFHGVILAAMAITALI